MDKFEENIPGKVMGQDMFANKNIWLAKILQGILPEEKDKCTKPKNKNVPQIKTYVYNDNNTCNKLLWYRTVLCNKALQSKM